MKLLIHVILLIALPIVVFGSEKEFPFNQKNIEKVYQLENGNKIYIEQYERGDRIWEENIVTDKITNISFVWNFIALAKECEGVKEKNIFFANNLEYYLGGGTNIDNPQIRLFSLYDPSPWRDSDLAIVPNMEWTNTFCNFYDELEE